MALRENYKPWIYVEIIHLGLFMDSMTNDKSVSFMKSLKTLLIERLHFTFGNIGYMLISHLPFHCLSLVPHLPSCLFLYTLLYFSYFNICLIAPIRFLVFFFLLLLLLFGFFWSPKFWAVILSIYKCPMCLLNKRMSEWEGKWLIGWVFPILAMIKHKDAGHKIWRPRRKRQKVKENASCDLFPLAQEVVLSFCQGNLESSHSRLSRYRLLKMDGFHQRLSWSYRPHLIGQVIVVFQLDSSNVIFLRKVQTPQQSE